MTLETRQHEDTNSPSYLNIIMYSDEHGETVVEGDEEEEQLANGVYEQHYEDEVFEIDDFPAERHSPLSSPEMHIRYYASTNEAPHGLSQSVNETHSFMRSMILSAENNNSQESCPVSTLPSQNSNSQHPAFIRTETDETIYSQSAPVTFFFSIQFRKNSAESPISIHQSDHDSIKEEESISQKTVSGITHDTPVNILQEDGTVTKSPVQTQDPLITKEDASTPQLEQSDRASSPALSYNETENNLLIVTTSQPAASDDSLNDWNSLATAYFGNRSELDLWRKNSNQMLNKRDVNRNSAVYAARLMSRAALMKVSGMISHTRHKDLQCHFFDSNVLFIRYVNKLQCAYIAYINYEEMMKSVFKFNGSVLRGDIIYCRPSFFEELQKDNELNSNLLYRLSQHSAKKHQIKRNSFVPEYHGISQYGASNHLKKSIVPLSQYHPQCVSGFDYRQSLNGRYPYFATRTVPIIRLLSTSFYFPSHYVVMKPRSKVDVRVSKEQQYWSVSLEKACQLNYLFRNSFEVNLIFSVKGSKSYQGYAVMKSEVLDLRSLTNRDTVGTVFQGARYQFKTRPTSKPWRYVFRIEWKSKKKVGFALTKNYRNPWFSHYGVNLSRDCTVLEPSVGKEVVRIISSH